MKKTLLLALLCLSTIASAQDAASAPTYCGKRLSPARLSQLFASHGKYLYTDGTKSYWLFRSWTEFSARHERSTKLERVGASYGDSKRSSSSLQTGLARISNASAIGDAGAIDGHVINVLAPNSALLIDENLVVRVNGALPSGLVDGKELNLVCVRTGSYQYNALGDSKSTVADLKILTPASLAQFAEFLANSKTVLQEVKTVTEKCPKCHGRGKIPDPKGRKMDGIPCPDCKGTGKGETKQVLEELKP